MLPMFGDNASAVVRQDCVRPAAHNTVANSRERRVAEVRRWLFAGFQNRCSDLALKNFKTEVSSDAYYTIKVSPANNLATGSIVSDSHRELSAPWSLQGVSVLHCEKKKKADRQKSHRHVL